MPPAAELRVDGARLSLSGELGFSTVAQVLTEGRRAVDAQSGDVAVLDLDGVTKSDSAGLALVVDWLRAARARNLRLELRGIPQQMADIARLSGLGGLMDLEDEVNAA